MPVRFHLIFLRVKAAEGKSRRVANSRVFLHACMLWLRLTNKLVRIFFTWCVVWTGWCCIEPWASLSLCMWSRSIMEWEPRLRFCFVAQDPRPATQGPHASICCSAVERIGATPFWLRSKCPEAAHKSKNCELVISVHIRTTRKGRERMRQKKFWAASLRT